MSPFPERGSIQAGMGRAYWEMIADEISRDGWSWGMCEAILVGRRMWVVDAHRGDLYPRHVVNGDTLLGAFLELKRELKSVEILRDLCILTDIPARMWRRRSPSPQGLAAAGRVFSESWAIG
jgi:hypothetical protein